MDQLLMCLAPDRLPSLLCEWEALSQSEDRWLKQNLAGYKMEAVIAQLSCVEAHDFDPEILGKLNSFLKLMLRHRIEYPPADAETIQKMVEACWTLQDPLALCRNLIELVGPRPEFTWSPLPLLRILAKIDPELRYIQLPPSRATHGHHGIYLQFKEYYIILLTNHETPLLYTQNVLGRAYLSEHFPDLIQKLAALTQIWTEKRSLIQMGLTWSGYNQSFQDLHRIYGPFLALINSSAPGETPMLSVPTGPPPRPRYLEE